MLEFHCTIKQISSSLILRKPKSTESITSACSAISSFPNVVYRLYPDDNYIVQQDSAPSHRCRLAQQFLQANTPHFIYSDAWPLNNPDLYPLDYYGMERPKGACVFSDLCMLVAENRF